ncbi:PH domain-containing protein, partial [Mycolicibacillus trivialis]|uniref:PH domain-containing protein n=1 Tax=Mycolicibacillus trivialis TaxID=1798 RepID=UPI0021F3768F
MLLVHPLHEVLRNLPLVFGAVVLGSTTGDPTWLLVAVAITVGVGVARWATTSYRIDAAEVQLRSGLLRRTTVAVPRTRIRSVSTDARLLHRLLGLTVLRVSTAEAGASVFELDAVAADEVPALRTLLLAGSEQTGETDADAPRRTGRVLARWQPSWLRYSPLSVSGLVGIGAVVGLAYQAGADRLLEDSRLGESAAATTAEWGVPLTVAVVVAAVVVFSVLGAVGRSLLVYGNLVLTRRAGVLHLEHGLIRQRAATFDMRRLRGGTVREPLLVRALGGAQLDAVMTGVRGAGEASLLLPPCPAPTGATGRGDDRGARRGRGVAAAAAVSGADR